MTTSLEFLRIVFGESPPGEVIVFALPGERSYWCHEGEEGTVSRALSATVPDHNVYFGVSVQDKEKAEFLWRQKYPHATNEPTTRGFSDSALALPGFWADIDVKSAAHASDKLPPTKADARRMLERFPLAPSLLWDTGYGLQAMWLFRELWVFESDEEREAAKLLVRRFIASLNTIADEYGWKIDPTNDLARVLRLPGTWNRKLSDPQPVTLLLDPPEPRYNLSDFTPYLIEIPTPKPFVASEKTPSTIVRDLERATEALHFIPADSYDEWLKMGMALHDADPGADGFCVWESWSQSCPEKFDAEVSRYKWLSFHTSPNGSHVTLGSLFALAKERGWSPPPPEEVPFPGDADAPPLNGKIPHDHAVESRVSVSDERDRFETSDSATFDCPDILWQGIFLEIANRLNKRSWEVWFGILCALGAVAHKNLHWYYHRPLYGMIYGLLISPTGQGKGLCSDVCYSLLPDGYTIRDSVQSGPALFPILAKIEKDSKGKTLSILSRPAMLIIEEWTTLVKASKIEFSNLQDNLNTLFHRQKPWNLSRSDTDKSGGDRQIDNATLSICATTTESLLREHVTSSMIRSGFLNRYFIVPGSPSTWDFYDEAGAGTDPSILKGTLAHLVSHAWGNGKNVWTSAYDPDAKDRLIAWGRLTFNPLMRADTLEAESLKRLHAYAHIIALLYAWSDRAHSVSLSHVEAAIHATTISKTFVERMVGIEEIEVPKFKRYEMALEDKVIAKIRKETGITTRKVEQDLRKSGACRDIRNSINMLLESGLLRQEKKGKTQVLYCVDN